MNQNEIKAAHAMGAEIECRCVFGHGNKWEPLEGHQFDFSYLEYRVKPKPPRVILSSFHTGFKKDEMVPMIELTPAVTAAIEAAGILIELKEKEKAA